MWSHTEWFELIYEHLNGVEKAADLAAHKIPWTDDSVKNTLKKYAELLKAGCCGDATGMLAMDWNDASDALFKQGTFGYQMIGMWNNDRARSVTASRKASTIRSSSSRRWAPATMMYRQSTRRSSQASPTAPILLPPTRSLSGSRRRTRPTSSQSMGSPRPATRSTSRLYGPVMQASANAVATSKVQFVLGDLLPGDLVDEYRVQLQKFLQDPSDATIDAVTKALEAKAATF